MGNDICAWRAAIGVFNCRSVLIYKKIRVKVTWVFVELMMWIQCCLRRSCYSLQCFFDVLQNNSDFKFILICLLLEGDGGAMVVSSA